MKQFIIGKLGGKTLLFEYEFKHSPHTYILRYGKNSVTCCVPTYLTKQVIYYWLDHHDQYDRETLWQMFGKGLDGVCVKAAIDDVQNYLERRVMSPVVYNKLIMYRPNVYKYLGDTITDFFMMICKEIMFSDNPERYL